MNTFEIVGLEVQKQNKELFCEMLKKAGYIKPLLKDASLIPKIVNEYCDLVGIESKQFTEARRDKYITNHRRMLVVVIYLLYHPQSLNPKFDVKVPVQFNNNLSGHVGVLRNHFVQFGESAQTFYRTYRKFREETTELYKAIKQAYELTEQQ